MRDTSAKQLRILTGRHAGARMKLAHGHSTMGSAADAQIHVSDWKQRPVTLTIDGSDVVRLACRIGGAQRLTLMEDFVPRRFGDIVVCVGPADDAAWPTDVELLSRMLKPRRRKGGALGGARGMVIASAACAAMLTIFVSLLGHSVNKAEAKMPRVPLQVRVAGALAAAGMNGLSAREAGRKVVVEGLVDTTGELARARTMLRQYGDGAVIHKYAAATDLVQSISDALSDTALRVRYVGQGIFVVEGAAEDVAGLRNAASRIASDLAPVVRRIDVAVSELAPRSRVHVDAMLVTGDVRYVQTRDGTKHLIVSPPIDTGGD